ncbi:MAG: HTTM domain-containing protein [Candidatus Cyclobacteriaceae bacterium M3_2C_046]
MKHKIKAYLQKSHSAAPLAVFRMLFGGIMLFSILRFAVRGWIYQLYIEPDFYFTYWGFDWVKPMGPNGMYLLFILMGLAAIGITLGLYYRISASLFFVLFTYVELIDKSNYLNHYYFVSIIAFLIIWLPANAFFSLDLIRKPDLKQKTVPLWTVDVLKLQLTLVYFYAGMAKINTAWLLEAMPLKIWLPPHSHLPVIGSLFESKITAYIFSWSGAAYDLAVPFLLWLKKTRNYAYGAVIIFHLLTWWLFPIGMFPIIMILSTTIFFSARYHQKFIHFLQKAGKFIGIHIKTTSIIPPKKRNLKFRYGFLVILFTLHFIIQVLVPWRFLLYPGNVFWTEQGYRFSWRVMLMEKAGYTIFQVEDPEKGTMTEVMASDYLTPWQEKMMATQPDMILQFAHYLKDIYQQKGIKYPKIYARAYVSLNGEGSRNMVDSTVDLTRQPYDLRHRHWVIPYRQSPFLTQQQ